ncbi:citrate (Si)-synthase [candidate division KSB1 bacterium]|nr:MAG: type I citrate synthase [candidate division KSB1 bacterium 4484_219]RKY75032.1 MAG: citrate (Si)-synthase [candidate division KSB1 bacterium]RKY78424.1 MAG: citrate (Si)-synthase [candidate division KSB1 bacterium]RKY83659.1 MAG: citrate (Si)-synthase [candidate division KSB1 bacterium]RKY86074.1 MAG: citrate (Si)-synthase [candidate division KSB1 bacterium]
MASLKEKLAAKIPAEVEEVRNLIKEHGDKVVSQVTVKQVFGGMRGVKGLVCNTSLVEPDRGLEIRGIPIAKLTDKLPEEILWLLLTGELPNQEELASLQEDLKIRRKVPEYVWDVLNAMPADSHPMTMLSTAVLVMEKDSVFKKRYQEGMKKTEYWEPTLEDTLDLVARLPVIAAAIYRQRFNKGPRIPSNPDLDMGADYAHMLGLPNPNGELEKLMRLYLVLHSDHEGGNVSAFVTNIVGSALSNIYYALSAGLNGLAGPLHGLANQECLRWVLMVQEKFGGVPTDEQLRQFAWDTLNAGKVIPGYGHAVLRVTDPRFDAFLAFGKKYCADDPVFQIVAKIFDVVPGVLKQLQKVKDPWPNVDAGSGALLYHYGMKEFDYYTVIFGISRAMGVCSQAVMNRALGLPIVRPKSVTTDWIKKTVGAA